MLVKLQNRSQKLKRFLPPAVEALQNIKSIDNRAEGAIFFGVQVGGREELAWAGEILLKKSSIFYVPID